MRVGIAICVALAVVPSAALAQNAVDENYRINAEDTSEFSLKVCPPGARLEARGDGDTDLDFTVKNASGRTVHTDFDTTDITFAELRPAGTSCEYFKLEVVNLGEIYNMMHLKVVPRATHASADGKNRDVSLRNRTGESIWYIYWSNTNATSWGQDRLGSEVLLSGRDWDVTVDDASGACNFDFRAVTSNEREIERRNVNVCSVYSVSFE